jgi:hypothetical protein
MRLTLGFILILGSSAACSVPFHTSKDEKKAECDRIAAEAIQTTSLEDAKVLSARASSCYAQKQQ